MNKIRTGVIGCGAISGNHFHAISKLADVQLAAVCDIDEEKLKSAGESQGAKMYRDWQELIQDPALDAVHICTPHFLHREMAEAALLAGKHVLCEKPMGMNYQEAQSMAAAAAGSGRILTVCFQNRFNPASRRMKALIASGELGAFRGGSAFVAWNRVGNAATYYPEDGWRGKWATEGGSALINQAIHTLDLLRWLMGNLKVQSGFMAAHALAGKIETEDTCDLMLEDEKGCRVLFYASNCSPSNLPVQMHLNFEQGEMHLDGSRLTIRTQGMTALEDYSTQTAVGKDYWGSGHGPFIEDFYRAVESGAAPAVLPEDAAATMALLDQAYAAGTAQRRRGCK